MNAEEKMRKAVIQLQQPEPFFAYLLMLAKIQKFPQGEKGIGTMAVHPNGTIYYGDEFVDKCSDDEVKGVLSHEILHIALLHLERRGDRNPVVANLAMDCVVNMMVRKAGMRLPDGCVPWERWKDKSSFVLNGANIEIEKVSTKIWESIYDEIMNQLQQQGKQPPQQQQFGFDEHMFGDGMSKEEAEELVEKWKGHITEAARYAKQQGKLPAGMDRYIDDLLKPKVRWKSLLIQSVRPYLLPVDWNYQRPHKKSKVLGTYLPNIHKEHTEVDVIVDTSGSVSKKELTEFISEIVGLAQTTNYMEMRVHYGDTKLEQTLEVENGNISKLLQTNPRGYGGTDMEGVIDEVREKYRDTNLIIVFTDGYTTFSTPREGVVWVLCSNSTREDIPYGRVIRMER